MSLETIPQEILEQIAYYAATEPLLGPPSGLIPLLLTNRDINSNLSNNPHLHAHIFEAKFDTTLAKSRLGENNLTPDVLSKELKRRFNILKRVRHKVDALDTDRPPREQEKWGNGVLDETVIGLYLMMLENEGKNESQVRDYAQTEKWLQDYWFNEFGSSYAVYRVRAGWLPPSSARNAYAMWLFWFLMKSSEYNPVNDSADTPINIMKIHSLAAHIYDLSNYGWIDYIPKKRVLSTASFSWYSQTLSLVPPPTAIPAILSWLSLVNNRKQIPVCPSDIGVPLKNEWGLEWGRYVMPEGSMPATRDLLDSFKPGSFEGVWEGIFTYSEFTAYAAMLGGAPPQIIQKSIVGRHQQTWKLREHYLVAQSGTDDEVSRYKLAAGDPLQSYFPIGTRLVEAQDGLQVTAPGVKEPLLYRRTLEPKEESGKVIDVIITGEGHSAWGQFNLIGRVRHCDGFFSLSKDYADSDRGKWLYRGFLVGDQHANLSGRWRDTMTSIHHSGYEGCFVMSRRRLVVE